MKIVIKYFRKSSKSIRMHIKLDDRLKFNIALISSIILISIVASSSWLIYDVSYFMKWDEVSRKQGLLYVYAYKNPCPEYKVAYPPFSVILFIVFYELGLHISHGNLVLLRLIVKIPLITSFILIAYLLYKYYGWNVSKWFFYSVAAYSTILSYQFDLIVALCLFTSFIAMYKRKNILLSGVLYSLAVLVKPLPVVLAPLYIIDSYKLKKERGVIEFMVGSLVTGSIIVLPFLWVSPQDFIAHVIGFHGRRMPQELSLFALPLYLARYDYNAVPSILNTIWIVIFFSTYMFMLSYIIIGNYVLNEKCSVLAYSIILLLSIALNKVGNNPYFVWSLPFLAIIVGEDEERVIKIMYMFIPIVSMVLYGFLTFITAAVVRGYVFLAEDLAWYNAYELLVNSFRDSMLIDMESFLDYLYLNYYHLFNLLYEYMWLSMIILTLTYVFMLLYLVYRLLSIFTGICRRKCIFKLKFSLKIMDMMGVLMKWFQRYRSILRGFFVK